MTILLTLSISKLRTINIFLNLNKSIYKRAFMNSFFGGSSQKSSVPRKTGFYIPESGKKSEVPKTINNEPILYTGAQSFPIRLMFTGATVNFFYWGYTLFEVTVLNPKEPATVLSLISIATDSYLWIALGSFGTGLVVYFTQLFASRASYQCYETADGKRLGFQMYNVLGLPGRKFEATHQNITFGHEAYRTTLMPIRVYGLTYPIYLDRDGQYFDNGRLYDIIRASTDNKLNISVAGTGNMKLTGPGIILEKDRKKIIIEPGIVSKKDRRKLFVDRRRQQYETPTSTSTATATATATTIKTTSSPSNDQPSTVSLGQPKVASKPLEHQMTQK